MPLLIHGAGGGSGGYHIGTTAPDDIEFLWIDTSVGGVLKYYNDSTSTWTPIKSVWG